MKDALAFLALIGALLFMDPFLDAPSDQQAAEDTQADLDDSLARTRAMDAKVEREAGRVCESIAGPGATYHWDENNYLVCHPFPVTKTKGLMQ